MQTVLAASNLQADTWASATASAHLATELCSINTPFLIDQPALLTTTANYSPTHLLPVPQTEAKSKAEKAAEDAYWKSAGEGAKSKAAAKKEEEEKKRLEQLARKAELKKLQEQEEAALLKPKANPKANRVTGNKVRGVAGVTRLQLLQACSCGCMASRQRPLQWYLTAAVARQASRDRETCQRTMLYCHTLAHMSCCRSPTISWSRCMRQRRQHVHAGQCSRYSQQLITPLGDAAIPPCLAGHPPPAGADA